MPERTCIGCRRTAPQSELVRVVRTPEGFLAVGRTLAGRGAYLCADSPGCVAAAEKRRAFGRALRGHVDGASVVVLKRAAPGRARIEGWVASPQAGRGGEEAPSRGL